MWGAIAGAAAQAGGGIYGVAEARRNARNHDWTLEMSQTAHQREVADLRKAGLNPILSAGGKGAAIGPGATAQTPDLASAMGGAVNSAVAVQRAKADVKQVNTETDRRAIDLALEKGALDAYNKDQTVRDAANAAMLAQKTGVSPNAAALAGGAESAWSAYEKHVQGPVKDFIDRMYEKRMRKHYKKLNRDVPKRLPRDGDITIRSK